MKLKTLTIEKFRGIKELTIPFDGKNFAICGNNGSGKSGVIDALEFILSGNISRLSGRGTAGITLKQHAPHCDHKETPELAKVKIDILLDEGKTLSIARDVKSATQCVFSNNELGLELATRLANHPEFCLSRKQLLDYVLAEAGARAKKVSALLRLERVDELRLTFNKLANRAAHEHKNVSNTARAATELLHQAIGSPTLSMAELLTAANEKRLILGLEPLTSIDTTTKLYTLPPVSTDQQLKKATLKKGIAESQVTALQNLLKNISNDIAVTTKFEKARDISRKLLDDPNILIAIKKKTFYSTGLTLVADDLCPLCELPWKRNELIDFIKGREAIGGCPDPR